jgi:hypothetical protein
LLTFFAFIQPRPLFQPFHSAYDDNFNKVLVFGHPTLPTISIHFKQTDVLLLTPLLHGWRQLMSLSFKMTVILTSRELCHN